MKPINFGGLFLMTRACTVASRPTSNTRGQHLNIIIPMELLLLQITNSRFHVLRAELFLLNSPRLPTCRRGYDSIPNSDATFTRVHLQLAKRVFLTFLRM